MNKPKSPEPPMRGEPPAPEADGHDARSSERRSANAEMTRVLGVKPLHIATDSEGTIVHWNHGALHDVVEPMADHVVMTYMSTMQRLERRAGKSLATGTARTGVVTIIPAGSTSRWDISGNVNVVQLHLPHETLARVAAEADRGGLIDLAERTGHPDPTTSRLLMSAADSLDGSDVLDNLFRQQLIDLLATRLLVAHIGSQTSPQSIVGGLSPTVLRRAIERMRSDTDADISLAALAADAGLSRFHFCRAFKESTGLSPHNWLRRYRLEQAMTMLRDPGISVASVAAELGYSSQTAFAAAFRRLTGDTPSDWRKRPR
ncbi:transcriptional regulatory protein [Afipia carboxidovorans OM5]|uniref:Transcriptional regulatory protein n=1 Tax=Afipia carboxidovorans (strain ATCC 49405 / DSM 1227 / KCTC 32145 / OM5) TaxID=504832 RepID=B6JGY3_AFIC5|nr:AraC family transcriptional regulator [Afipia carboxidovorans]ACI93872.1 transcriptional regulatory protein [Afipia carboxidovorans OM5]AEI02453.1 transcriptional regulatory protein [Afipia carboxidovorans OM4]AEI06029.1 transcriptional regulatory protein [Afipia carboxidovorans OM5]